MFKTTILALSATFGLAILGADARATHDTGSSATLRALVGQPARYAIFQYEAVQFTTMACDTFVAVDLAAKTWNERGWSGTKTEEGDVELEGDQTDDPKLLKAALERCLDGFGPEFARLEVFPIDQSRQTAFYDPPNPFGEPEVDEEGQPVPTDKRPANLRHLEATWELASKGPSRLYTEYCSDEVGEDGKPLPVQDRCESYLLGQQGTWRLVVKDTRTGATTYGTTLGVDPTQLLQVMMGLSGETEPDDVGLPIVELGSIGAYETADHVFLFGSAHHEPTLNGTYFPVAAFVPKRPQGGQAAYASPRGCACEGSGGPPIALAGLVLLVLWIRARPARHI